MNKKQNHNKSAFGRDALISLAIKYQGNWDEIYRAVKERECPPEEEVEAMVASLTCKAVTILDPEYPQRLRNFYKAPFVLFYGGDLSLISDMDNCVAYIGSRNATLYGKKMATEICSKLAKDGKTIISGLARGIHTAALKAALPYGKAVAVLGNGVDYYFPPENRELQDEIKANGLVISEYPPKLAPTADKFPLRNRIIAGLSKCVVVGGAEPRSGTLVTVGYATSFGKDVGCVPYPADEKSACNALIKEGAAMIENAEDVLLMMK